MSDSRLSFFAKLRRGVIRAEETKGLGFDCECAEGCTEVVLSIEYSEKLVGCFVVQQDERLPERTQNCRSGQNSDGFPIHSLCV